mmetsp:Transcript_10855/g.15302  ORF Transcript_10855/g.15302 Transcript_10855/m.15302 type:complete len:316 (+) Transcript_10855:76-1023(+)
MRSDIQAFPPILENNELCSCFSLLRGHPTNMHQTRQRRGMSQPFIMLTAAALLIVMQFDTIQASSFGGISSHFEGNGNWNSSPFETVSPPPLEFAHGTTTLSFKFQGGIIAAVDSRASIGNFVGSKTTQKVLPVSPRILGTMAGGAADCGFWIRKLKAEAKAHQLKEGRSMSVARASRILSNALYQNKALGLSVGTMIMGFDDEIIGKPSIYYVDNTGVRIGGDMFSVGSGSTFALGILDTEYRYDLTEDEAIALGIKAIRHATFRDAFSGGFIGVYLITKDGWRKVFSEDLAVSAQIVSQGMSSPEQIEEHDII